MTRGEGVTDGGAAFPMRAERRELVSKDMELVTPGEWPGMSLRDYFAAASISAMMAASIEIVKAGGNAAYNEEVAKSSYALADAMLRERSK